MGVFCTDRSGATVFGASRRAWVMAGDVLVALGAEHAREAFTLRTGTLERWVPSRVTRAWGDLLFADLGEVVVVSRPRTDRPTELTPVGVYRRGSPAAAAWTRAGEHLSVYDTALAPLLLRLAQACAATPGFAVTTLRPPAPGTPRSDVAVRTLARRSGLLARRSRRG